MREKKAQVRQLKAKLEANRATCDLFNMDKLAASLEGLYAQMCAAHQAGQTPTPDLRNLDLYLAAGAEEDHEAREMQGVEDYLGLYREKLARRHRARPIPPDGRVWTEDAG